MFSFSSWNLLDLGRTRDKGAVPPRRGGFQSGRWQACLSSSCREWFPVRRIVLRSVFHRLPRRPRDADDMQLLSEACGYHKRKGGARRTLGRVRRRVLEIVQVPALVGYAEVLSVRQSAEHPPDVGLDRDKCLLNHSHVSQLSAKSSFGSQRDSYFGSLSESKGFFFGRYAVSTHASSRILFQSILRTLCPSQASHVRLQ